MNRKLSWLLVAIVSINMPLARAEEEADEPKLRTAEKATDYSKCNPLPGMMMMTPQVVLMEPSDSDDKRIMEYFGNSRDLVKRESEGNKETVVLKVKGWDGQDTKFTHELEKAEGHPKKLVAKFDENWIKKSKEMAPNANVYSQTEAHFAMSGKTCRVQKLGMRNDGGVLHVSYDRALCQKLKPLVKQAGGIGKLNQCTTAIAQMRELIGGYNKTHKANKEEVAAAFTANGSPIEPKANAFDISEEMRAMFVAQNCYVTEIHFDKKPMTAEDGMAYAVGMGMGFMTGDGKSEDRKVEEAKQKTPK